MPLLHRTQEELRQEAEGGYRLLLGQLLLNHPDDRILQAQVECWLGGRDQLADAVLDALTLVQSEPWSLPWWLEELLRAEIAIKPQPRKLGGFWIREMA